MYKFSMLLLFLSALALSCSDDNEMEKEMVEPVNITTLIIGSYHGTNKFSEGNSFITEDDKIATASSKSDSIANINISSFFSGTIKINAQMNSEIDFVAVDVTVLTESSYAGSGTISGDTLRIDLTKGNNRFEYIGVK